MKFSIAAVLVSLLAAGNALVIEDPHMTPVRRDVLLLERQNANNGRPVSNGACCIANTSKKQDVCTVNGQQGKCVPANTAGCNAKLTCIRNAALTCNNNVLENGRPLCRPK
ncbi:hypothetical protein B0T26DRAFT_861501 [Lasiosphaeria miniovina]|uniref:Antifungal protein n=1 Tax=Lasiosphaeria miniovina TaxID=1954250 RepID=A0AA40DNH8_9PEZI|nr:uncharacterized protein B0T26DRAFT_861501 [Lasiosphaeria miniovina]KAK0710224.1 hypothetical protein B0T26DRAFT_861501 [Lasiosphaeria miniovina]